MIYGDSAYWKQADRKAYQAKGVRYRINRRAKRNETLSKRWRQVNRARSTVRARGEHSCGSVVSPDASYEASGDQERAPRDRLALCLVAAISSGRPKTSGPDRLVQSFLSQHQGVAVVKPESGAYGHDTAATWHQSSARSGGRPLTGRPRSH